MKYLRSSRATLFSSVVSILFALVCILTFPGPLRAQDPDFFTSNTPTTLSGTFERIFRDQNTGVDSIRGSFYFTAPGDMFVQVTSPVNQYMIIREGSLTIFYPETKQAFRFNSANPILLPLITGLMATVLPDFGMGEMGFSLKDQHLAGDTLVSVWAHPQMQERLGRYEVFEMDEKIMLLQFFAPKGISWTRTRFDNYQPVATWQFPLHIFTQIQTGNNISTELVHLSDLKANTSHPEAIRNFRLPPETILVEKQW